MRLNRAVWLKAAAHKMAGATIRELQRSWIELQFNAMCKPWAYIHTHIHITIHAPASMPSARRLRRINALLLASQISQIYAS